MTINHMSTFTESVRLSAAEAAGEAKAVAK